MPKTFVSGKTLGILGVVVLLLITMFMNVAWNEAGKRQVVQYADGTLSCVFEPGPYMTYFGSSTEYPDVMTMDFDRTVNNDGGSVEQEGIGVRYRDGGLGTVYGIARYALPGHCEGSGGMLEIHKELRSANGLAFKMLKPFTEETANQTAGLMTSEESYAEKRGIFTDWFRQQLVNGRFKTRMDQIVTTEPGKEFCLEGEEFLTAQQKVECRNVKKTRENVPVIDDSQTDIHLASDLDQYGITLSGFQLQAPDYEPKTLQQISDKREATMGVITANANAERAKAEAEEAEQRGIKEEVEARYAALKIAAKEVVDAEKKVKLAEQSKLEAQQKAEAAEFYKQEQILMGEGEAERKRLVMEADGALEQKLAAWEQVNRHYSDALAQNKLVPDIMFGSGGEDIASTPAHDLMSMLMVKTAKDLQLNMQMK